jgi:hypothetical protein
VAIAGKLHVITQQAPPCEAARLLRRPLSGLLRDTSPQVRAALLAGLADTLQVGVGCLKPTCRLVCKFDCSLNLQQDILNRSATPSVSKEAGCAYQ